VRVSEPPARTLAAYGCGSSARRRSDRLAGARSSGRYHCHNDEFGAAVWSNRTMINPTRGTATMKLTTTAHVSVDGAGVSIQVYRPTGRPQYAMATAG
jgi:hypothetical protein